MGVEESVIELGSARGKRQAAKARMVGRRHRQLVWRIDTVSMGVRAVQRMPLRAEPTKGTPTE
jgi:hypothetical protein